MTNHEIAKLLRQVQAAYTIKDEKKFHFQIVAYQKAADSIDSASSQIADLIKENKIDQLPGVGSTIKSHLEELVKTGKVKHFQWAINGVPVAVFPLLEIPSIGPKKAYKLVKAFKLKNPDSVIEDLEKIAQSGKIARLESFGEKSQQDLLRAIDEYRGGKGKTTRMLLPYATEIADKIIEYLFKNKAVKKAYPLGSLRRKVSTIGDIDIAVATDNPKAAIEHFTSYPYKERVIEKGPASASILTSGGKQVDFMTQPVESFGSLLQHFTGSKHHNVHLRDIALRKGLSMSEYGIKKISDKSGKRKHFTTEETVYHELNMDYIPPEMREDTGEIESALNHSLPKIVELKNIKGDLHIHSSFPIEESHDTGKDSMDEMIKKAKNLGYEYIGFSEHNPSMSKHNEKEVYTLLEKRKNRIEQLKKSNKNIRIVNLLETDILVNGDLAISDKCLDLLDATIVSVHSSFSLDPKSMTKRVLKGLSNPNAKILAHPTGRLLNQRPGYNLDWKTIFEFCQKNHKALEINSWPSRLDLPDNLVRQAVEAGVKLVIDTDSHAVNHMDLMEYGVSVARRGWATKDDILNTLEYNTFIKWLKS